MSSAARGNCLIESRLRSNSCYIYRLITNQLGISANGLPSNIILSQKSQKSPKNYISEQN